MNFSTATAVRDDDQLQDLVKAVRDAHPTDETRWLEWKGPLDFSNWDDVFLVAKAILGFANRNPDIAAITCDGEAYVVVGAEPGTIHGFARLDGAVLDDKLGRYVDGPDWTPRYVDVDGTSVLVIAVAAPAYGDRIHTLMTTLGKSYSGTVFHRRVGKSAPANAREMRMLQDRLLRNRPEDLMQRFTAALDSGNARALSEAVTEVARDVIDDLTDVEQFPRTFTERLAAVQAREYLAAVHRYRAAVAPLLKLVITGCRWGSEPTNVVWGPVFTAITRPVPRNDDVVADTADSRAVVSIGTVNQWLEGLTRLPGLLLLYAATIASIDGENYDAIRVLADAEVPRGLLDNPAVAARAGQAVARADPRDVLGHDGFVAVLRRDQHPHAQVTDEWLAGWATAGSRLRFSDRSLFVQDALRAEFPDHPVDRYRELFDQAEMLLSLIMADLSRRGVGRGPWLGRFVDDIPDSADLTQSPIIKYLDAAWLAKEQWAPLAAGLLGGSVERLQEASSTVTTALQDALRTWPY